MIRLANVKDISQINNLGLLLNKEFIKLFNLKAILKERISRIYIYELDKKIVGFLHITKLYENVDIINLAVDPNFRREHIASNLLDNMLSDISGDVKMVTLEVNVNNLPAINLYKKFGFEIINERKHYYEDVNAYLMGKVMA